MSVIWNSSLHCNLTLANPLPSINHVCLIYDHIWSWIIILNHQGLNFTCYKSTFLNHVHFLLTGDFFPIKTLQYQCQCNGGIGQAFPWVFSPAWSKRQKSETIFGPFHAFKSLRHEFFRLCPYAGVMVQGPYIHQKHSSAQNSKSAHGAILRRIMVQ